MIKVETILMELKKDEKIFASEYDFQFHFSWKLKELYPEAEIILEYPIGNYKQYLSTDENQSQQIDKIKLDILVLYNGKKIPIELKYKTSPLEYNLLDTAVSLKSQGAQNYGKYNFCRDVERVEYAKEILTDFHKGYVIMITNDLSYLKDGTKTSNYYDFSIHDNRLLTGNLKWKNINKVNPKSIFNITIKNNYFLEWNDYLSLHTSTKKENNVFKYLLVEVI